MDDRAKQLIEWVLNNKKQLNLSVKHYVWTHKWLPEYVDLHLEFDFEGTKYSGRGTADNENLAFVKAAVEAIERTLIHFNSLENSNGIALHFDRLEAKQNAIKELIERDLFLCHYLTQSPFYIANVPSNFKFSNVLKTLLDKQIHVFNYEMKSLNNYHATICFASGLNYKNPFGLCLGLACENTLVESLEKSTLECLRHVISFVENSSRKNDILTIEEFLNKNNHSVQDHIKLANHQDYFLQLPKTFKMPLDSSKKEASSFFEIQTDELQLPFFFRKLPLVGIRALNSQLQNLYFGITNSENINLKRLSAFSGKNLKFTDLVTLPHPLG